MNRRMLFAGASLAGVTGLRTARAQEASPIAEAGEEGSSVVVLRAFLETVLGKGDARAVDEFFDANDWDLDALYWYFADLQADGRKRDDPFELDIRLIYGDDHGALAFGIFGAGSWTDREFFMAINSAEGLITAYSFMSDYL